MNAKRRKCETREETYDRLISTFLNRNDCESNYELSLSRFVTDVIVDNKNENVTIFRDEAAFVSNEDEENDKSQRRYVLSSVVTPILPLHTTNNVATRLMHARANSLSLQGTAVLPSDDNSDLLKLVESLRSRLTNEKAYDDVGTVESILWDTALTRGECEHAATTVLHWLRLDGELLRKSRVFRETLNRISANLRRLYESRLSRAKRDVRKIRRITSSIVSKDEISATNKAENTITDIDLSVIGLRERVRLKRLFRLSDPNAEFLMESFDERNKRLLEQIKLAIVKKDIDTIDRTIRNIRCQIFGYFEKYKLIDRLEALTTSLDRLKQMEKRINTVMTSFITIPTKKIAPIEKIMYVNSSSIVSLKQYHGATFDVSETYFARVLDRYFNNHPEYEYRCHPTTLYSNLATYIGSCYMLDRIVFNRDVTNIIEREISSGVTMENRNAFVSDMIFELNRSRTKLDRLSEFVIGFVNMCLLARSSNDNIIENNNDEDISPIIVNIDFSCVKYVP